MNHEPTGRAVHGQAGDTTGQVDTGDRVHEVHTPAASVEGHPEGTAMDATVKAWTASPPLPYRNDQRVHPWDHFWGYYYRWKRRPRCDESGED